MEAIQAIPEFVGGQIYPTVIILEFNRRIDDLKFRGIVDPLKFVFQFDPQLKMFKINFNPTEGQVKLLRIIMDIIHGKANLGTPVLIRPQPIRIGDTNAT